jgi:outer membrane lipoprotein carrier protein
MTNVNRSNYMQSNNIQISNMPSSVNPFCALKKIVLTRFLPILACSALSVQADQATTIQQATKVDNTPAISAPSVIDTAKQQLIANLAKLSFFSANFTQQIIDLQGQVLLEGSGTIAMSKPNLIHWQTITPDETLLVSDGNTLWSYDPFIEQASAYSLAKSIHNTPILLLTSDEPALWQTYQVIKAPMAEANTSLFEVLPLTDNGQIKKLTLSFTEGAANDITLTALSFEDATGQISQISLTQFNATVKPADSLFKFTLPQGVRLEDER